MEKEIANKFRREHRKEIRAVMDTMDDILPKLETLRQTSPQVGYMIHFGIWDPVQHWVYRHIDIEKQLAAEIFRDELQEEEDLRQWVLEHIDENVGEGYAQHFDLSESAKVQK